MAVSRRTGAFQRRTGRHAEVRGIREPRRRIAHVVRQYVPSTGGLETYVEELSRRQSRDNVVYVITLDRIFGSGKALPRLERRGRVVIVRVGFLGFREFFIPFLSFRLLKRFSIIHVHATDQLLDLVSTLKTALGLRYVVTTHGLFFHTERFKTAKKFYLRYITRRSLARSEAVFAVSANDSATVESVGIKPILLRNPIVPLGSFIAEGRDLVYIGRIAPNKRVDKLVEFARVLAARDPLTRLHIVGSDPDGLWPEVAASVERGGVRDRILYHGHLSREDLQGILRGSGYVVSASRYEGYGLSMIEGMSVGLLPVMQDNAAFRETFSLSRSGIILDFGDPEGAATEFLAWRESVHPEARTRAAEYARAQTWDAAIVVIDRTYKMALDAAR